MSAFRSISLFLGRLTFLDDDQSNAVLLNPKTQYNQIHGFGITSTFDTTFSNTTTELFYDKGLGSRGKIFYAGTYSIVDLNLEYPGGFLFNTSYRSKALNRLREAVQDTQTSGDKLSSKDIRTFLQSGDIKIEFIGLKKVGFNVALYNQLTGDTMEEVNDSNMDCEDSSSVPVVHAEVGKTFKRLREMIDALEDELEDLKRPRLA